MTQTVVVNNLTKSFGKYRVIDNLSFSIEPGCVYGLVGLNGAGKTTLLRLLLGILKPDSGTVTISGSTPWKHHPDFYRRCGVVLESDGFWGNLTAAQNCEIYAAARGVTSIDLKSYLDTFWHGSELFTSNKKVRYFSRGQRMQCALSRAFMGHAAIYFLDEPVITLDLKAYEHFKLLVKSARDRGATLIISSHQLDTIDDVCDRVGILRDGRIVEINHNGCSGWYINTTDNPVAATILSSSGASSIRFEQGWHFTHPDAATGIPHIISQLVAAEFPIREVRTEEPGFGETIRSLYAGLPSKEQP